MTSELNFSESDVSRFETLLGMQSEQPGTSPADWADRELAIRAKLDSFCQYERGLAYHRALDAGYYPSMRKMAETLGEKLGPFSSYLHLARLPKDVLAAIGDLSKMRPIWGRKLTDRLQRDPDLVLMRAKEIIVKRAAGEKIAAMSAYRTLSA